MAMLANPAAPPLERIRQNLVGLRMPRVLEILNAVVSRLERGEITALKAIDVLLAEELTLRESRRIKAALVMARISLIKSNRCLAPTLRHGLLMVRCCG